MRMRTASHHAAIITKFTPLGLHGIDTNPMRLLYSADASFIRNYDQEELLPSIKA